MNFLPLWIFGALAILALPVIVVVLVVRAGRHGGVDATPGAPVRRFFQYGLMFVALVMAAIGLDALGRAAFETGGMIGRGSARVATPLALVIVGMPLFFGLAAWTRRRMVDDPSERSSVGWLLYITFAPLTALVVAAVAISEAIGAVLRVRGPGGAAWVTAAVWGAAWAGHWVASTRHPPADESRSHRLLGSLLGLGALLTFGITLGAIVLTWAYRELFSQTLVTSVGNDVRALVGPLAVAAAVWWWYWLRASRRQAPTVGWNAYVLLGGVLGGLMIALVAAGTSLFAVLAWAVGEMGSSGAVDHFAVLPGALVAAAIGGASWLYHRSVFHTGAAVGRAEVGRAYVYLVAAVGLLASAAGVTTLLVAAFDVVARPTFIGGTDPVARVTLGGLTLLVIGLPLWWKAWAHVQGAGGLEERTSPSRRLYLSGSFGLGGVVAVISLFVAVAAFFEDLLDGSLGRETLFEVRVETALVLTIGAVAAYHWRVFRADRALAPGAARTLERLVVVAGDDVEGLVAEVARRTGARVEGWRVEGVGAADAGEVVASLEALDGSEGIVTVDADGVIRAVAARRVT
jgi:hypothetical protein